MLPNGNGVRMIKFITSMNERLFNEYGQRFLTGWRETAGEDTRLTVYGEGGVKWLDDRVITRHIDARPLESDAYKAFRAIFGRFLEANGRIVARAPGTTDRYLFQYNYRFDALRFCFKAFSFMQEIERDLSEFSHLVWIDADIVCKRPFTKADLEVVLPAGSQVVSYLGRTAFPPHAPHSECGFVAFNLKNPVALNFIRSFVDEYSSGRIFTRSEWHDSFIFDVVRRHYEATGQSFKNISGEHHAEEHPFVLSPLGVFFDHLKGPARKAVGRS
jgi:hypothetical protein